MPNEEPKVVTIEFAGLSLLVTGESRDYVRVLLPHTRAVAGPRHWPVLLVPDHAGLRGTPDFAITLPTADAKEGFERTEYAGWHLRGTVRIEGDVPEFEEPDLAGFTDFKEVSRGSRLSPTGRLPVDVDVLLDTGKVTALPRTPERYFNYYFFNKKREKEFVFKDANGNPARLRMYDRCLCTLNGVVTGLRISFDDARGNRESVFLSSEFEGGVVVSNLTAGSGKTIGHLEAYYDCVDAKRRPQVEGYDDADPETEADEPENPDECYCLWMEV